jgi:hypothetical protein
MKIDLSKVEADLAKTRRQKTDLLERLENLTVIENQLADFITMAQHYATNARQIRNGRSKPEPKAARFQPNKFRPVPIPDGYVSPHRRTELARKIIEAFEPNTIISAASVVEKIGPLWDVPKGAKTAKHHMASVMIHETGPAAILDRVQPGHYRIKTNAMEIIQSRVAAEIAQAQDDAARQTAH